MAGGGAGGGRQCSAPSAAAALHQPLTGPACICLTRRVSQIPFPLYHCSLNNDAGSTHAAQTLNAKHCSCLVDLHPPGGPQPARAWQMPAVAAPQPATLIPAGAQLRGQPLDDALAGWVFEGTPAPGPTQHDQYYAMLAGARAGGRATGECGRGGRRGGGRAMAGITEFTGQPLLPAASPQAGMAPALSAPPPPCPPSLSRRQHLGGCASSGQARGGQVDEGGRHARLQPGAQR